MHALGHAAHDAPVGAVIIAKDTWTFAKDIATGNTLPSGMLF